MGLEVFGGGGGGGVQIGGDLGGTDASPTVIGNHATSWAVAILAGGGGTEAVTAAAHSFTFGYATAAVGETSTVESLTRGVAMGTAAGGGTIRAPGEGFAMGSAYGGTITASGGLGSFALGYADTGGTIDASGGYGAFAIGAVSGGNITSSGGYGSFAGGYAGSGGAITASGYGSFAFGYAGAGSIVASGLGSVQFGPGTNAEANSVQVGSAGIRLLGAVGPAGTPQNGDIYVDGSGNVVIHSGGVAVTIA